MEKPSDTRELLIISAGELFADHGFDGVSTRMIADRAGVKLSAIHYHFGSKDNLYIEACLAAHEKRDFTTFSTVIQENPSLTETPLGLAEIIRTAIFRKFHDNFRADRPEWQTKILLRELANPTEAMVILTEKIFKPDAESSFNFYRLIKPDATSDEAAAWTDMMYGELLLYKTAKQTLEMVRGENTLNEQFYHTAAAKLSRAMILEAGLPLPADLQ